MRTICEKPFTKKDWWSGLRCSSNSTNDNNTCNVKNMHFKLLFVFSNITCRFYNIPNFNSDPPLEENTKHTSHQLQSGFFGSSLHIVHYNWLLQPHKHQFLDFTRKTPTLLSSHTILKNHFNFLFWEVLEFEVKFSHLQDRCSTTWATPSTLVALVILEMGLDFCPGPAWTTVILFYTFYSCWDARCMPLCPAFFFGDEVSQKKFFSP
jgi:hypothetical protein